MEKYYITTAISYPNGAPHIGHAYEVIATDAIARFMRLAGKDVFFLTGTDEHGQKMVQTAQKAGISALELADQNSQKFRDMVGALNISNDDFIRTTEPRHKQASQILWEKMQANGDVYIGGYEGWYSVRDEAFYNEDETHLNAQGVRIGGQGTPVEWTKEETFFFRLSNYQEKLLAFYEANPDFVQPASRFNEVIAFVKSGLNDLSISRTTFDWGIEVPGVEGHVMYVWVDALTNYITATETLTGGARQDFWPANLHIIGKDIVRFHAIYWPAFLMSAGIALPKKVFGHGFLFNRGEKMSKSLGNVVDPIGMAQEYGVDQMRYFFLREVSFGQDGNYNHELMVNRINADLANDLGNLAQRSLSMLNKNCGGVVPNPHGFNDEDEALLALCREALVKAHTLMDDVALHRILETIWGVVAEANRYFAAQAPWGLKKTDFARMETVLYVTAEVLRQVAILASPFIPEATGKLLDILGQDISARDFKALLNPLRAGMTLPEPKPLFPRYVEKAEV
jgi:methionyl-tRNA synthetase